ncbi:MAG: tetratricopeptide repeat protein [Candidatus Hydrogenedentes bacterium]|nr:tetratricopeptide repeat protein [Candidatus Hydrogenedentota bacterium]
MRNLCVVLLAIAAAGCFQGGKHEPPRQAVELNNQAYRAFQQSDMGQALLLVNDAIRIDAKFADAYVNKAAILDKLGKRAEAVAALETLLKLKPGDGGSYVALGVLLEKMGRREEAEPHYGRALKLFSEQSERASAKEKAHVEVNKAVAQYLAGDTHGAVATLDGVLAANPKMDAARAYKERIASGRRESFLNGPR